ncbi:5-bromo-4-chloroindolyl phosphate hydrolysis family protein [Blautia sp. CLA-JM-H16]|uniref:5-bromo-4-chloroindolyl phosphate hydrolysis family protein n=1 Tax=Blautia aquisgranensis TaxID=3133153 RepID=A0ABV1BFY6_9FIRM
MDNNEFDDLGKKIQDIIDNAINSNSYQELSHTINRTVNKAIDSGSEALKSAMNSVFEPGSDPEFRKKSYTYQNPYYGRSRKAREQAAKKQTELLYGKTTGENLKGMMMAVSGGILLSGMGLGAMVLLIWMGLGHSGALAAGVLGVMCAGAVGGGALLGAGTKCLGRLGRFQKYIKVLGDHTYCNFQKLAQTVEKTEKFVKKDVIRMIDKGWFLEGHVDAQETCLITSNETYAQYQETQKQLELRKQEADPKVQLEENMSPEAQDVLKKGNEFLVKIRQSNDAIPGEEISAKISRMELIVQKIFERAGEHPEVIPDLRKLMDYYLPMTVKLLDAYEDMDGQPVQGENITSSKKEIEDTIDTLNLAFEKLLDSIFRDTAWDVSSDISVLHTVLAQEGLTEDDFEKMKQEAGKK